MENPLDKLRPTEVKNKSALDVITSLMDKENLVMKTEITNPYALDTLMMFAKYFNEHGYSECTTILENWKDLLLEYMVSHKRLSRIEITEILKGFVELEKKTNVNFGTNLAKLE